MKVRDAALRVKRFEADESARKIENLQQMVRDFEILADDLDRQIAAEEDRTGIRDPLHFSYSMFAKAAAQRRDNLRASSAELQIKLEALIKSRGDVENQLAQATAAAHERGTGRRRTFRNQAGLTTR
jgi:hypothetical protein